MFFTSISEAQRSDCDLRWFDCTGDALFLDNSSGGAVQYVDVERTASVDRIRSGFTYEMHLRPNQRNAQKTFIAGVWGPFVDINDSWVIYFNNNNELVFELNGTNSELGQSDNTIARASMAGLWQTWFHLACVYDASTESALIYINGELVDSARNDQYPVSTLRRPQSSLGIQIGSTNALYNQGENNAVYDGYMDEIRIWNLPRTAEEISCNTEQHFTWDIPELEIYLRCNNHANTPFIICDAAGNENTGLLRSGASLLRPPSAERRPEPDPSITIEQPSFPDTLKCVDQKVYTFRFRDTASCGGDRARIWARKIVPNGNGGQTWQNWPPEIVYDPPRGQWIDIEPGEIMTLTATLTANYVGYEEYEFFIQRINRCDLYMQRSYRQEIHRITEFSYDIDTIRCGELLAHCVEEPYRDVTFQLFNNSIKTNTNRNLTVTKIENNFPEIFEIIAPSFPAQVGPDNNMNITVRFNSKDTTAVYDDILTIYTDDACDPIKEIPISGFVNEIIGIEDNAGFPIDTMFFGSLCANLTQRGIQYYWENYSDQDIQVIDIEFPNEFKGSMGRFPTTLEPNRSYPQRYIAYEPTQDGSILDSVIIVATTAGGCTIRKPIVVFGRALDPQFEFVQSSIDFGNVLVGQRASLTVDIRNIGNDNVLLSGYLVQGDQFEIISSPAVNIPPGQVRSLNVQFEPLTDSLYIDELTIAEPNCYRNSSITIQGRGVIQNFSFTPEEMRIENVIACGDELDTIFINNELSSPANLSNFNLNDPSGRFSVVEPPNLNSFSKVVPANSSEMFIFRYSPNDVTGDRADQAYLEYESDGIDWATKMLGTSAVPRVFMTHESLFGTIEIFAQVQDTLTVENIASLPIKLDSLQLIDPDGGFRIVEPVGLLDTVLQPRGTMEFVVEFMPTNAIEYNAQVLGRISEPCLIPQEESIRTELNGFGKVIPLDISTSILSYGFTKPCDCKTVEIPMVNRSREHPMSIDSIWIDDLYESTTISGAKPISYEWTSTSFSNAFPYELEINSRDTLNISYCPRGEVNKDSLFQAGSFHVRASGPGWDAHEEIYLGGQQMLIHETGPDSLYFPPTLVNTFSIVTNLSTTTIPDFTVNPDFADLVIDSVSFYPDDKVFFFRDSLEREFPFTVPNIDTLFSLVDFKPRAPREYEAIMVIHFAEPCDIQDSSVNLYGSGFAPVFGLAFEFEDLDPTMEVDTFSIPDCDTLLLPVYTDRAIPGEIVDIYCNIKYDTASFRFLDIQSEYFSEPCLNYTPSFTESSATYGSKVLLKNFCYVDSLRPIFTARFIPYGLESGSSTFKVDSIEFDTEEVILFDIIAEEDITAARVFNAEFQIDDMLVDFDSVRVYDCVSRTFTITNTGEVDILVNDILVDWNDTRILDIQPPLGDSLFAGEVATIITEFCPHDLYTIDSIITTSVLEPCSMFDTTRFTGLGYAPEFFTQADISEDFIEIDTVGGILGDTLIIPVYFEKDVMATYRGIDFWMHDFNFNVDLEYYPRALKYLDHTSDYDEMSFNYSHGFISMEFRGVDSMRASKIADLRFQVTIADSLWSDINVNAYNFSSDTVYFLDVFGDNNLGKMNSTGACNLDVLRFNEFTPNISQNRPNPWIENTKIEFTLMEKAPVELRLYDAAGNMVLEVFDGSQVFDPGNYEAILNASDLKSGIYFYKFRSGQHTATKKMLLTK